MPNYALKIDQNSTYRDYLTWPDQERWEIIEGVPYNMSPAPSRNHQKILGRIFYEFYHYLRGKTCEVYGAPFDVRLPLGQTDEQSIENVVQPDIAVICDPQKLDAKGCLGAPDLIVEILSPGTAAKDMKIKLALYERAQVQEYWLVHPEYQTVMVYRLGPDGSYGRPQIYTPPDELGVGIFPDLSIPLTELFEVPKTLPA